MRSIVCAYDTCASLLTGDELEGVSTAVFSHRVEDTTGGDRQPWRLQHSIMIRQQNKSFVVVDFVDVLEVNIGDGPAGMCADAHVHVRTFFCFVLFSHRKNVLGWRGGD